MAIPLVDQYSLSLRQTEFRARVAAALMNQAITAFSQAPAGDPVVQAKRMALASAVLANADAYVSEFAWIVVTRPDVVSIDTLTDSYVVGTVAGVFDLAAVQIIPDETV